MSTRHSMSTLEMGAVFERTLYLGVLPKGNTKLAHLLRCGVEQLLVAGSRLPSLVLLLQSVADNLQGLVGAHGERVCTQDTSAFDNVYYCIASKGVASKELGCTVTYPALLSSTRDGFHDVWRVHAEVHAHDKRYAPRFHLRGEKYRVSVTKGAFPHTRTLSLALQLSCCSTSPSIFSI